MMMIQDDDFTMMVRRKCVEKKGLLQPRLLMYMKRKKIVR